MVRTGAATSACVKGPTTTSATGAAFFALSGFHKAEVNRQRAEVKS